MAYAEISRWIEMAEVVVKRSISKQVLDRARSGKCLHCDSLAVKRGLCSRHYEQFRRAASEKKGKERVQWECEQIRDGQILPVNAIARIKSKNVFRCSEAG